MREYAFGRDDGKIATGMRIHFLGQDLAKALELNASPIILTRGDILYVRAQGAAERLLVKYMEQQGYVYLDSQPLFSWPEF